MKSFRNIAVCFSLFVVQAYSSSQYCASINSAQSAGASGYFAMQINSENQAQYLFSLNLTEFSTTCNLASGLVYHIHTYWNTSAVNSAANSGCGLGYTGNHYDPNFACSNASQSSGSTCVSISRTKILGYSYNCSTTNYKLGRYSFCELGDLAGKFGKIYPSATGSKTFSISTPLVDYIPPYAADYNFKDQTSNVWNSVVFHCVSPALRLVCAKLSTSSISSSCTAAFSTMNPSAVVTSNDDSQTYTKRRFDVAVILSTILCFFGGLLIGALSIYFTFVFGKKEPASSSSSAEMSKV